MFLKDDCLSEIDGPGKARDLQRWRCEVCNVDVCRRCVLHLRVPEKLPLTVNVKIHPHAL